MKWRWAKRMVVFSVGFCFLQANHGVNHHLVAETFGALMFKHLDADHYVFKFLGPVCGDAGFLNRSWAFEVICGERNPVGTYHQFPLFDVQAFDTSGLNLVLDRFRGKIEAKDVFWFDAGGYLTTCGVLTSTHFPYRDLATAIFNATLELAEAVVDRFWQDEDSKLAAWWEALWWGFLRPARRELSKSSVSRLLAHVAFLSTHRHDYSHSPAHVHDDRMIFGLRRGSVDKPESYLPSEEHELIQKAFFAGLASGNVTTPLNCWFTEFPDMQNAVQAYVNAVEQGVSEVSDLRGIGSLSH